MELRSHSKLCGFYKIEAVKLDKDGNEISRRVAADWFPNLITNLGLNQMGDTSTWLSFCQVGSGSTTPAVTDIALVSRIANSNSSTVTSGNFTTSPYGCWKRLVYRFNEGVAAGNLSEVGVGPATTGSLFSRALILDALGNPTTITILSDETLDVTYEVRMYPKLTDDTGTVIATGNIGGTYDWIFKASDVDGASIWDLSNTTRMAQNYKSLTAVYAGDGAIGAITGVPTGTSVGTSGVTLTARTYVADSYEVKFDLTTTLAAIVHASGVKCFRFYCGSGHFQLQFTPAIPKTANDILTFVIKHSWGRV